MRIIGITGGVGSGKSYVAKLTARYFNVLHINTDEVARMQMKKGGASFNKVIEAFGDEIICTDGEIDRERLASIVFNDDGKRKLLNSLTHPTVTEYIENLIAEEKVRNIYSAVLIETAILKEAGYTDKCDEVWYVYAPYEDRKRRLMETRGYTEKKVGEMMGGQLTDGEFRNIADFVIYNYDGISDGELFEQISPKFNYGNIKTDML